MSAQVAFYSYFVRPVVVPAAVYVSAETWKIVALGAGIAVDLTLAGVAYMQATNAPEKRDDPDDFGIAGDGHPVPPEDQRLNVDVRTFPPPFQPPSRGIRIELRSVPTGIDPALISNTVYSRRDGDDEVPDTPPAEPPAQPTQAELAAESARELGAFTRKLLDVTPGLTPEELLVLEKFLGANPEGVTKPSGEIRRELGWPWTQKKVETVISAGLQKIKALSTRPDLLRMISPVDFNAPATAQRISDFFSDLGRKLMADYIHVRPGSISTPTLPSLESFASDKQRFFDLVFNAAPRNPRMTLEELLRHVAETFRLTWPAGTG